MRLLSISRRWEGGEVGAFHIEETSQVGGGVALPEPVNMVESRLLKECV